MIAALFPGQGAQQVGMGAALAERYEVARRTFAEADEVLGYPLSRICFEGPAERLMATDVCQPALVATSIAAFRVAAEETGLAPDLVLGHSLGEYSALVAAGALDIDQALTVVAERGAAMREAGRAAPGGMLAVMGLPDEEVEALAARAGEAWAANYNCPGQVAVSGTVEAIDRLVELARERRAKVVRLAVDGAFHSPLMAPAAERLRPALERWEPREPQIPFLSTTTCEAEPAGRLREVLLAQLTSPVRFGAAVEAALAHGVERTVELGPGKALSGMVRRVRRDVATAQVATPEDLETPVAR